MTSIDTQLPGWEAEARQLGEDAAKAAASWITDGNEPDASKAAKLAALDFGDASAWDYLNGPDLSGEYADGPTPQSLLYDIAGPDSVDWDPEDVIGVQDALAQAFEDGVAETFGLACEAELKASLGAKPYPDCDGSGIRSAIGGGYCATCEATRGVER